VVEVFSPLEYGNTPSDPGGRAAPAARGAKATPRTAAQAKGQAKLSASEQAWLVMLNPKPVEGIYLGTGIIPIVTPESVLFVPAR
jgi:hypothetical protein